MVHLRLASFGSFLDQDMSVSSPLPIPFGRSHTNSLWNQYIYLPSRKNCYIGPAVIFISLVFVLNFISSICNTFQSSCCLLTLLELFHLLFFDQLLFYCKRLAFFTYIKYLTNLSAVLSSAFHLFLMHCVISCYFFCSVFFLNIILGASLSTCDLINGKQGV